MNEKLRAAAVYATFAGAAAVVTGAMIWNAGRLTRGMEAEAATANTAAVQPALFGGRCTLTTATPVMTTTVASATSVFYTPSEHNRISLYNGSDLVVYEFAELSNVTTNSSTGNAGPAVAAGSSVYDYFVWFDGSNLTLTRGPAWTNTTTRNLGLTRQQGVWVNASAITNGPAASRGTYVCTAGTDAGATINWKLGSVALSGGQAILGVWNMYNRKDASTGTIGDTTDNWTVTQTGSSWLGVHATSGISAVMVRGLDEDLLSANYSASCSANNTVRILAGIGIDSNTAFSGQTGWYTDNNTLTTTALSLRASYDALPGIGMHTIFALESANGTATCNGDAGAPTIVQTGLAVKQRM